MESRQFIKNKNTQLIRSVGFLILLTIGSFTLLKAQISQKDSLDIENLINTSHSELVNHNYNEAIKVATYAHEKSIKIVYQKGIEESSLIMAESYRLLANYSKALHYYLQVLSEIEKNGDKNELIFIYQKLGELFYSWDVPEKAILYLNNVLKLDSELERSHSVSLLTNIAETYIKLNQYPKALTYFHEVLEIQKKNDSDDVINTLKRIASIYSQLDDLSNALTYNFEMLAINRESNDSTKIAVNLNSIGSLYKRLKDYPKSLVYYTDALEFNQQMNINGRFDNSIVSNFLNIGIIQISLGDYRSSEINFNNALNIKKKRGTPVEIAVIENYLASINFRMGKYREAKNHTIKAIELLKSSENKRMLATNYKRLSDINQQLGEYQSALKNYEQYSILKDSILYRDQLIQEQEKYKQYVIGNTEKESKLEIIDYEMKALSLKNEEAENKREKQEIQLRLTAQELQNASLKNQQLEGEQQLQALKLDQKQLETESKNQEIILLEQKRDLQEAELKNNAILEREQLKEIELQKRNLELQNSALEGSKSRQRFLMGIVGLFSTIIILIIIGFRIKQNSNNRLTIQNKEITSQKEQIEEVNTELVELNEEKNNLIDIVAHDLKSPLNQILGFLNIIKLSSTEMKGEVGEFIPKIDQTAQQLKKMVTKILNVSAIESKKINVNREEVDLTYLLEECVIGFEELAKKKNITIKKLIKVGNAKSDLDAGYVFEVFTNLLSNAIKYSPLGRTVTVSLAQVGNNNRLEFIDEGEGIRLADMDKLFKKYHKLSSRPTAGEDSTGLGLSIVKKYVEEMGGKVWCESEEGKGANFIVEFEKHKIA